jgi:ribonuclease H / adenosylcobalamin/alpha-ribazole phosphatase
VSTLILVRHAATAWTGRRYAGRSDPPLSADGRVQAARLAIELADSVTADVRLISSPSRRARATAASIASAAGPHPPVITIDDRWREADFGDAEGLTFDELMARYPDLGTRLAAGETGIDWPGGETADSLAARVRDALDDIAAATELVATPTLPADAESPDPRAITIVISHAGPIRVAVAMLTGTPPERVDPPAAGSVVRLELPVDVIEEAALLPSRR